MSYDPFDDFRTRFLTEARLAFSVFRPTAHVKLTGITDDGPLEPWMRLLSRYTVGERERRRERKIRDRTPKVVWRSS